MNITKITEILKENGYENEIHMVYKGGVVKTGVCAKGKTTSPVVYLEDFSGNEEEVAKEIMNIFKNVKIPDIDTSRIASWENASYYTYLGLRPKTSDTNTVKETYLDLEVYAYIRISDMARTVITNNLLNTWGVDKKDVFKVAKVNTIAEIECKSMKETLSDFGVPVDEFVPDQIILTNNQTLHGAIAMYFSEFLHQAANMLNTSKIVILPSSIHEIIAIDDTGDISYSQLNSTINEINIAQVDSKERLSNHCYVFNTKTGKVTAKI